MKLLLASHKSGLIHIINNHPQDRSNDPSKTLGPSRGSRALIYVFAIGLHNLVNTVEPFEHCFTEPGLLGQSLLLLDVSIFDIHGVAVVRSSPFVLDEHL